MNNPNSSNPHSEPAADNVEELFLLHMRYKEAQQLISGIHQPILLTNPNTCWLVYAGFVDLFVTPLVDGKASGNRIHLTRFYPGQTLFGISPPQEANLAFLAVANNQTVLLELPTGRLQALAREEEFQPIICQMIDINSFKLVRLINHQVCTCQSLNQPITPNPNACPIRLLKKSAMATAKPRCDGSTAD